MKLVESILNLNPCYTAGKKIKVTGLMLHSVGCSQPRASAFINIWNNPSYSNSCVHAVIDGNAGTVYQTLPWDYRGRHCGSGSKGSGNSTHIGIEMCEPACIKYIGGAKFTCSDTVSARDVVKRTYETAVELFAMLCKKFGLDPLAAGVIISHKEGYNRGIASNHGDPEHLWSQLGTGYTMDGFRKAVKAAMGDVKENLSEDTAKVIWDYLTGQCGLRDVAAAGIMGNMQDESGFKPNNLQNTFEEKLGMNDAAYTAAVDSGKYSKEAFVNDKAGYGLAQWTYWSRKQGLYEFAKEQGASIADLKMQLDFFWKEISGNKVLLEKLQNAGSVLEASNAILHDYERPADQSESVEKKRAGYGQAFYDLYSEKKIADSVRPEPSSDFLVKVLTPYLNIRKGPGTNYDKAGNFTGIGTFTIAKVQEGEGADSGWGLLKAYEQEEDGWISLDFTERV